MDLAIDSQLDLVGRKFSARIAGIGLSPITHLGREHRRLIALRAGQIVVQNGQLVAVFGRWWPYKRTTHRSARPPTRRRSAINSL